MIIDKIAVSVALPIIDVLWLSLTPGEIIAAILWLAGTYIASGPQRAARQAQINKNKVNDTIVTTIDDNIVPVIAVAAIVGGIRFLTPSNKSNRYHKHYCHNFRESIHIVIFFGPAKKQK